MLDEFGYPVPDPSRHLQRAAEQAVMALMPLLPIEGSWLQGYHYKDSKVDTVIQAEPMEWALAAQTICDLHTALVALTGSTP